MAQIFPKWTNQILKVVLAVAGAGLVFVVFVFWFWFSPWNLDVGYEPVQPLPFSHKTHAGVMGLDCRYCHTGVDKSSVAGVPPTQTCMNCHHDIKKESLKLRGVGSASIKFLIMPILITVPT